MLIEIEWEDAVLIAGEHTVDDLDTGKMIVVSVGFLVYEDINVIIITRDLIKTNDIKRNTFRDMIKIPKRYIISRKELK